GDQQVGDEQLIKGLRELCPSFLQQAEQAVNFANERARRAAAVDKRNAVLPAEMARIRCDEDVAQRVRADRAGLKRKTAKRDRLVAALPSAGGIKRRILQILRAHDQSEGRKACIEADRDGEIEAGEVELRVTHRQP